MFAVFLVSSCYLEVTLLTFYLYRGVPYARYVVICALFNYFTRLYRDIYVVLHCCWVTLMWSQKQITLSIGLAPFWQLLCDILVHLQVNDMSLNFVDYYICFSDTETCFLCFLNVFFTSSSYTFQIYQRFFYWKPNNQVCLFTYVATQHTQIQLPFS